jgi:hypothetical protein
LRQQARRGGTRKIRTAQAVAMPQGCSPGDDQSGRRSRRWLGGESEQCHGAGRSALTSPERKRLGRRLRRGAASDWRHTVVRAVGEQRIGRQATKRIGGQEQAAPDRRGEPTPTAADGLRPVECPPSGPWATIPAITIRGEGFIAGDRTRRGAARDRCKVRQCRLGQKNYFFAASLRPGFRLKDYGRRRAAQISSRRQDLPFAERATEGDLPCDVDGGCRPQGRV